MTGAGSLRGWEWAVVAAVAALVVVGAAWRRWGAEHPWGRRLRSALAWADGPAGDALAIGLVAALHLPAVLGLWRTLQPWGGPSGPDSDDVIQAAVALETGDWSFYPGYRYPTYPWLVSLLASERAALHVVGQAVSMAALGVTALAAYTLARRYGGRWAGVVAASLTLRLPGPLDIGRMFTPYATITALEAVGVAALAWLASGSGLAVVPLSLAAAGLFASDAKQVPAAVGMVLLGAVVAPLARGVRGVVPALVLLATLPATNAAMARFPPLTSMEVTTTRVTIGLTLDPEVYVDGWAPGDPLTDLPATLGRLARGVHPPARTTLLSREAERGLAAQFPDTSAAWLAVGATLPLALAVRRRRVPEVLSGLAPLPLLPVALGALHLYYQHRYFSPVAAVLPAVVVGAVAVWTGPWGAAGLALALAWPGSPWRQVGPGLLDPQDGSTDRWGGVEARDAVDALTYVHQTLPADARILDFSPFRPWTFLAEVRDYTECSRAADQCRSRWAGGGPIYVIARPDHEIVTSIPRYAELEGGGCWSRVYPRPSVGALYAWTCADAPTAPPAPPPRPPSR